MYSWIYALIKSELKCISLSVVCYNPFRLISDFGILLWLTPDDFSRQSSDVFDKKRLIIDSLFLTAKCGTCFFNLVLFSGSTFFYLPRE